MIIVTGAAGFIGSCLISKLNQENFNYIIAVDDFSNPDKEPNLANKQIQEYVDREQFFDWLDRNYQEVEFLFHIGARTDTTEFDYTVFDHLNVAYSKQIWEKCVEYQIPLVYASSAATYGLGELGYDDNESLVPQLKPLNPYGESKNEFDIWALQQERKPFFWAGLKFFNVYGPNEYHKGRMASVIFHAHKQIGQTGGMKLFRSHNPDYTDGGQMRDFVYVKDVLDVCLFLMHHRRNSGIYNLGSGTARTFLDLANNTFAAMDLEPQVTFIDTPADIRDKYQYYTQANMAKLRSIGYEKPFHSLEAGIADYVRNYLQAGKYL
ncbi:ADP-L-glycero-D-manno-heptose-6-epimerase [Fibrella aestuarina BUZ 2]|uniref:ADP-L-glycero-D-manno-heptose-6-epimerase n=1 Tax=Fibrella aestuarina BUZ 2 TaxID=1166018 RepID=I0K9H5_9BACT|nr:ADP-glyceromanno-heptose 6-epimerase [Fibrella aestuarina]CCH00778.1 ADP-L-glycero-D-manno-heptose-6-epimerase [Fibrella aestuarina BUZ 2]